MVHLEIAIGCLFTIIIEVAFFVLFGYRDKRFLIAAILANLSSNLILNYIILIFNFVNDANYGYILLVLEILVWIYEAVIYLLVNKDKQKRLEIVLLTLAANCLSFLFGMFLYQMYAFIGI